MLLQLQLSSLSVTRSPSFVPAAAAAAAPPLLASKNPTFSKNLFQNPTNSTQLPFSSSSLQCQHFQSCSGCSREWNLDRPVVLSDVNQFFKSMGVSNFTFDSGRLWEWRCRAKLAVRGSSDNPQIGLYQEGTHTVVDIPHCRAHHPSINYAIDLLKEGINQLDIQPYEEDLGTGELRYVQMAVTTYNTSLPAAERYHKGKVQVTLVWNSNNEHSPGAEKLNALSEFLWRRAGPKSDIHLIHSIWVNFQTSSNNVIFGNRWRHVLGERDFWEHVGGVDICLAPSSFGQANTQAFDSLLRKLQTNIPYGASIVDIYAGAGIIGLSLAFKRKCRSVKCVEINKESKLSFEKSVTRLPKSVDSSISWHHADASIDPLYWLAGSDVVVVDPPRKGLHPSLLDALRTSTLPNGKGVKALTSTVSNLKDEKRPWVLRAREAAVHVESKTGWERSESWPQTLVYISCGWESFKEDCRSLVSNKAWHVEKAHGFNFFPGTNSIEVLAVFKRGPRPGEKNKKKKKKKTGTKKTKQ